ncbi:MAG: hypothetical protein ACD_48C00305G0001, partial [uncultured bacterium]
LAKPHRIIIITPHEGVFEDAFVVNAQTELESRFSKFGDMTTQYTWKGSPDLAAKIQHKAHERKLPTRLVSNEYLGHGASIPLIYLSNHLKDIPILPIGYSKLDPKAHIAFGALLKEVIMESDKRIAIIASGDMAHTLAKESPAGFHEDGLWFDTEIRNFLTKEDRQSIQTMDQEKITNADECLYRSLLILCGILSEMHCSFEEYAYEAPFGVGYLTGQFHVS